MLFCNLVQTSVSKPHWQTGCSGYFGVKFIFLWCRAFFWITSSTKRIIPQYQRGKKNPSLRSEQKPNDWNPQHPFFSVEKRFVGFLFQDDFSASSCQNPSFPKSRKLSLKKKQPCWDTKLTSNLVRRLTPTGGIPFFGTGNYPSSCRLSPAWHSFASWPPFNDIQTANSEGCEGLGTEPGGSTGGPRKIQRKVVRKGQQIKN